MAKIMSSVYMADGGFCWPIAESPNEIDALCMYAKEHGNEFIEVEIGDHDGCAWEGRKVRLRAGSIVAIGPPLKHEHVHSGPAD